MKISGEKKQEFKEKNGMKKGIIKNSDLEKVSGGLRNMPIDIPKPISDGTKYKV